VFHDQGAIRKNLAEGEIMLARVCLLTIGMLFLASRANAAPVPPETERLIRGASPAQLDTVAAVAKSANPNSAAEIDALVASIRTDAAARRRELLATQGFFAGWSGEGQVGGFVTSGNTEDSGFNVGLALNREGLMWNHRFNAIADFLKTSGTTTREQFRVAYQLDYRISDLWFAYGLFQWERDVFAQLDRRFTESVGVGYTVFSGPPVSLALDAGVALRQTAYIVPAIDESDVAGRATARFAWDIRPGLRFTEDAGGVFGGTTSTLFSRSALTVSLTGALSARASFDINYESNPPPGVETTDTITRFTLVYSFST
jgi:putative salt-induced outer membrane protein